MTYLKTNFTRSVQDIIRKIRLKYTLVNHFHLRLFVHMCIEVSAFAPTLITRFMGPTCGPSGADRTQVGPMLAPANLLSGYQFNSIQFNSIQFNSKSVYCHVSTFSTTIQKIYILYKSSIRIQYDIIHNINYMAMGARRPLQTCELNIWYSISFHSIRGAMCILNNFVHKTTILGIYHIS